MCMDGDNPQGTEPVVVETTEPEAATEPTKAEEPEVVVVPEAAKEPEAATEPEKVEEPAKAEEPEVDVEELMTEVKLKESQVNTLTEQVQTEQAKVLAFQEKVAELEAIVKGIVEAKTAAVPEAYRALIPEDNFTKQLEWLNKAETTGLFGKKENPEVEIGATLDLGNSSKDNYEELTAQQKLSNYFSNFYK